MFVRNKRKLTFPELEILQARGQDAAQRRGGQLQLALHLPHLFRRYNHD